MTPQEFASFLEQTLQDSHLSRGERQQLQQIAAAVGGDEQKLVQFRKLAFEKTGAALGNPAAAPILEWLEGVLKALQPRVAGVATVVPATAAGGVPVVEAHFSPGEECCRRLIKLLDSAKKSLDICVFTITDDRISSAILAAHRRRVRVRIITDDEKSHDLGSDIADLKKNGVAIHMDDSPYHMHHKFVLVDGEQLLNGSFNWTRSASMNNQENFIISNDPRLIAAFQKEFDKLWAKFAGN